MLNKWYKYLFLAEESGKTLGVFRGLVSILGGLILSYLAMILLAFIIPLDVKESAILSIMFSTFSWAIISTWIALAHTRFDVLLRVIIPIFFILISIYFLY